MDNKPNENEVTPVPNIPVENKPVESGVNSVPNMPVENKPVESGVNSVPNIPVENKPVESGVTPVPNMPVENKPVEKKYEIEDLFVNPLEISNKKEEPVVSNSLPTEVEHDTETKDEVNVKPVEERPENIGVGPYNVSTPKAQNVPMKSDKKLKEVEIEYKPPSKGKTILLIAFFLGLIGFVIFLPEISKMVEERENGMYNYEEKVITTGKLKCSMETNTTNLDKSYDLIFEFSDSKLESGHFSFFTRGDVSLDEEQMNEMNASCKKLEEATKSMAGVTIRCSYTPGKLTEEHIYNYISIDSEQLETVLDANGGKNLEYEYKQNIDEVEKNLLASGYHCERE